MPHEMTEDSANERDVLEGQGRPPRPWEVAALVVIVPAVGAAARALAASGSPITPRQSALFVAVCGAVVGGPLLAWSFERARVGLVALGVIGAMAGAVPPLLLAGSGLVGFLVRGGTEYLAWALPRGISLPIYGPVTWPGFLALLAWGAVVGLASGVVYALLIPCRGWRHPRSWAWVGLVLLAAVAVGAAYR